MIPNQWYVVLDSKEVRNGKLIGVTRLGEKMVFWRDSQGEVGCLVDQCPHRGVAFSAGKLVGDCIRCPFHGFEFDSTGRCRLIPANGRTAEVPKVFKARAFPVRELHNLIYLWWGEPREDYPALADFDFMNDPNLVYSSATDLWNSHYSRAIENQLDVVHLPFVHYNTIGRGNRTVVNGPRYGVEEFPGGHDLICFWTDNEVDQGQIPLKPNEMPSTNRHPQIRFRFPNLWHNWLGDTFHLFLGFAPIDGEHTKLYLRTYHAVKTPIVRQVFNFVSNLSNIFIERQDRRVVVTQRPFRTELRMGEKLIPGDAPIIEYRRRRQALINGKSLAE
ncbi:MAG TPA: aromatic ring-hydroxylating dioxygenase subunit alpha [Anaerolineales bacterium]|nr:aromatic ring-hydroxylating dioxygenase subunit alpha [Anaerolineales bacterium]